ncbi:MAG: TOBE domain-containing protein [Phycisphaerae bacterium]
MPVVLSVRPEAVRLLAAEGEAPAENVFAVTVLARTFQGETEQARVHLGRYEILVSDRPTDLPPARPGEPARVHLAPEAIRIFVREIAAIRAAGAKTAGE